MIHMAHKGLRKMTATPIVHISSPNETHWHRTPSQMCASLNVRPLTPPVAQVASACRDVVISRFASVHPLPASTQPLQNKLSSPPVAVSSSDSCTIRFFHARSISPISGPDKEPHSPPDAKLVLTSTVTSIRTDAGLECAQTVYCPCAAEIRPRELVE